MLIRNTRLCFRLEAVLLRYKISSTSSTVNRGRTAAWSPLAGGLLTERYLDGATIGPGDRLYDEHAIDRLVTAEKKAKVRKLAALAAGWEMRLSELVIAYMLCIPGMGPVIPASSNTDQLSSNAKGGKLALTDTQLMAVEEVLGNEINTRSV